MEHDRTIHFISGLPRSGSTLLSAILRQNPHVEAGMTSAVSALWSALVPKMGSGSEFASFFDDERRKAVLRGVIFGYYAKAPQRRVVIDTNRSWTGRMALVNAVFPSAKIICCVRNIGGIINSVESALRANPLQTSRIFGHKLTGSVYTRAELLMNSESGLVGLPWSALREAWFGEYSSKLLVIDYEDLTARPKEAIAWLYDHLGLPPFAHDFDNVVYEANAYDDDLGMPGMHTVRPRVEATQRKIVIPPDLLAQYADASFWRRENLKRDVAIFR